MHVHLCSPFAYFHIAGSYTIITETNPSNNQRLTHDLLLSMSDVLQLISS